MNPILLRYVGFALVAVLAGVGGGYLAVNGKRTSPPPVTQSGTILAVPAQPFPGQGLPAIPAIPAVPSEKFAETCPVVPYHKISGVITSVSGATANASLYPSDLTAFIRSVSGNGTDTANRIEIRSLFKTSRGVLFAAGSDYLWSEFNYLQTIYRSTDQGKTWATVFNSTDSSQSNRFINSIAEDANGVLWAVGMPGVMKSTDGGMNWTKINVSFTPQPGGDYFVAQTYRDFVRNVVVLKDNSVLITVPFYSLGIWGYAYTNVYQTTDGGATWNLLFTQKGVDIRAAVETQDGTLVFTDQGGRIYRFAQGVITQIFSGDPRNITVGPFFKARNGTLYYVLNEEKNLRGAVEVVPTVYRSSDSGATWRKTGNLPSGTSLIDYGDSFAEGADGRLYLTTWTNCWGGTVYQSSDQGKKWEVTSGNVPGLSSFLSAIEDVDGKVIHGGNLGGVIFTSP